MFYIVYILILALVHRKSINSTVVVPLVVPDLVMLLVVYQIQSNNIKWFWL